MAAESDSRSAEELLVEATKTRQQAARFRQAAIVNDELVEMSLRARAEELDHLAKALEAQATKKGR